MMLGENIHMAISSMLGNKLRTFLSLLGIMIGVASVVAILNLGQSVTESMTESFEVGGLDTVNIMPRGSARETQIFTEEFAYSLMREIDGIREVLPTVSSVANVRNRQEVESGVSVQAISVDEVCASLSASPHHITIAVLVINTAAAVVNFFCLIVSFSC